MNTAKRGLFSLTSWLLLWTVACGSLPQAVAQEACADSLTAILLPTTAVGVEAIHPDKTFQEPLRIAASPDAEPTAQSFLKFDVSAIPKGAHICAWTLRLYLKKRELDVQKRQLIRAFPVEPFDPKTLSWKNKPALKESLAFQEANQETPRIDFRYPVESSERKIWLGNQKNGIFSLGLSSPSAKQDYAYYSLTNQDASCPLDAKPTETIPCFNAQPRLVVKYDLPPTPLAHSWPQYNYDPQHSGRSHWKLSALPETVKYKRIYSPKGYIEGDPVVYRGDLFFHTQLDNKDSQLDDKDSKEYFITAVSGTGKPLWSDVHIGAVAIFQPMVDKQGRLYVVSENDLVVLDLENSGKILLTRAWHDVLKAAKISVHATPTLGSNGALYLSTNQGIYALTPYPELKISWKYPGPQGKDNSLGRITLSQNEATLFAVNGFDDGKSGDLIAIDIVDGQQLWRHEVLNINDAGKTHCKKETLEDQNKFKDFPPVPVVGEQGTVFVTNGYYTGNCLLAFDAKGRLIKKIPVDGGRLSQPVVGSTGTAYFIKNDTDDFNGVLCQWNPQKDESESCISSQGKLAPHSILVMNGNDTIFAVDRNTDPQHVRGYTPKLERLFDLSIKRVLQKNEEGTGDNFGDNLLVAPDGTLYVRNRNHLFAIVPEKLAAGAANIELKNTQGLNNTAVLAQQSLVIKKDTKISQSTSTILNAGSSISIEPGFTVEKGSHVLFKTGF